LSNSGATTIRQAASAIWRLLSRAVKHDQRARRRAIVRPVGEELDALVCEDRDIGPVPDADRLERLAAGAFLARHGGAGTLSPRVEALTRREQSEREDRDDGKGGRVIHPLSSLGRTLSGDASQKAARKLRTGALAA
jgi:hypothetical protein